MKRLIVLAACVIAVGCGGLQSGAEKAVRQHLKDPDSARFGEFYYNEKTKRGCLAVNAKNSMGGYTGNQQAYVALTDNGWEVEGCQSACKRDPLSARKRDPLSRWRKVDRTRAFALRAA